MGTGVHIVSIGARASVGHRAHNVAAAARSGINRFIEHPFMVDRYGDPIRVGMDVAMPPEQFGVDRMLTLAHTALAEAVAPIRAELAQASLVVALPEPRP